MNNYQEILQALHKKYSSLKAGELASYIPELLNVDPELFSLAITTVDGKSFVAGNIDKEFSLQSTSKPFVYGMALMDHGREYVHKRVGVEPSGEAFNSIIELEKETHRPFNPMVNSGAIAIANMIKDKGGAKKLERVLKLFENLCGRSLSINEEIFLSEKKTAHRNRAIAHLLRHFDVIDDDIEECLDLYFKQCSIMVNVQDLSQMAASLANNGVNPLSNKEIFSAHFTTDIISLIFTCGMYDSTGLWAYQVGIPAKSGVSGAILGIIPGKMGIAMYSPRIDSHGHSVRAIAAFRELSTSLKLNIFT